MKLIPLLFLVATVTLTLHAQSSQVLSLAPEQKSPPARINQVQWIVGEYECPAFGGMAHEIWTAPRGNNMMGAFQLIDDGRVSFYEIMTIVEHEGSLILRLKHFDQSLHGWEEKDETVDFPLVKLDDENAWFDGLTFQYINKKRMNVHVAIESMEEIATFEYKRVKKRK